MAYLVACLAVLRDEFDRLNPGRDKASDGWIGDADHSSRDSDHNPDDKGAVHAIDVDETGPWPAGGSMEKFCQFLVTECRKSGETGLDRGRLKYIIYERRIWEASSGWAVREYTGSNPHDKHMHVSCEYAPEYENDDRPWGIVAEFGDTVSQADVIAALESEDGQAAIYKAINKSKIRKYQDDGTPVPEAPDGSHLMTRSSALSFADKYLNMLESGNAKAFKDLMAEIKAIQQVDVDALARAIVALLPPNALTYDGVKQAVSDVLLHGAAPATDG